MDVRPGIVSLPERPPLRPRLPFLALPIADSALQESVAREIKRRPHQSAPAYFGADLRAAFHAYDLGVPTLLAQDEIFQQIAVPIERVFGQPSPEPAIFAHWNSAKTWAWSDERLLALASNLIGKPARFRDGYLGTAPGTDSRRTVYVSPDIARQVVSRHQ